MIQCPKCQTNLTGSPSKCTYCGAQLGIGREDFQQLREELFQTRRQLEKEIDRLDFKLVDLENRWEFQQKEGIFKVPESETRPAEMPEEATQETKPYEKNEELESLLAEFDKQIKAENPELVTPTEEVKEVTNTLENSDSAEVEHTFVDSISVESETEEGESIKEEEPELVETFSISPKEIKPIPQRTPPKPKEPRKPSQAEIAFQLAFESVLAPLAQFKEYATEVYFHYKKQNKLPVFFMTIGGILAILFGFGYLMQANYSQYFDIVKVIVGFLASVLVILWGKKLLVNEEKYGEFGSALFGLGISLNYLMIYSLAESNFFMASQNLVQGSNLESTQSLQASTLVTALSLILVFLNTAFATWLALQFETRIVAVVSLLGGAFAPFYLDSSLLNPFYFAYLWLLCGASIYIGKKIDWKPLGTLAFLVSSIVLEIVLWDSAEAVSLIAFTIISHAFAYLFLYFALFEEGIPKFKLIKEEVFVLAASMSLLLLNLFLLFRSHGETNWLGVVYLANSVVWLAGFYFFRSRLPKRMHLLFFVMAGTFVGLAIPALFGQSLMGLFWGLEGLALVTCGFIFGMSKVRKEGFFVVGVGIWQLFRTFGDISANWGEQIWHTGFVNFLILGIFLIAIKLLLDKFRTENKTYEQFISYFSFEAISIWAFGVWFVLSWQYLGLATYNLALIPVLLFAYWGNRNQLPLTEILGLAGFALVLVGLSESIVEVNSYRFGQQTWLGKIAMLEIGLSLWALQLFYEKLMPNSPKVKLMRILREVFYIAIPWIWLKAFNRTFPEWLPLAFWASSAMSFGLSELLRKKTWVFGKQIMRNQGYLAFGLGILLSLINWRDLGLPFAFYIWTTSFIQLLLIGAMFGSLKTYLDLVRSPISKFEKRFSHFILEILSAWAIGTLLFVGEFYLNWEITILLAGLSIFGWFWWANREKLPLTEFMAIGIYTSIVLAMIVGTNIELLSILLGRSAASHISFLEQDWFGKLAQLESLLLLLAIPLFYKFLKQKARKANQTRTRLLGLQIVNSSQADLEKTKMDVWHEHEALSLSNKINWFKSWSLNIGIPLESLNSKQQFNLKRIKLSELMETLFWLLIPVFFLPTLAVHAFEYMNLFLWASVAICFGLHEWRKSDSLLKELHFLIGLATLWMVLVPSHFSVGLGLITLLGILFYKKGLTIKEDFEAKSSHYKFIFTYTLYFVGLCLALAYGDLAQDITGMFLLPSIYFYLLVQFREKLPPLSGNTAFAYRLGNFLSIVGLAWILMEDFLGGNFVTGNYFVVSILTLAGVVLYGLSVYHKSTIYLFPKATSGWKADLIFFHLFTIAAYTGILNLFFSNWNGVGLTVMLTIHSIILLFNSARPKYKLLMRFAIGLFVVSAIKLKFYDMRNFDTDKQIIVLMVVGVLLLVGANLFARFRKNLMEDLEEENDEVDEDLEDFDEEIREKRKE
jgi:hypothetical protein